MKRRAVFFDRDNTLIACDDYLGDPDRVALVEGAAAAVARARALGYATVTFSNQSGVARGFFGEDAVYAVNARLDELLHDDDSRAVIDRHEFCPHHPDAALAQYRRDCDCRKPKPGMLFEAAAKLALDLGNSWVIGDAPRDVEAGRAAGCRAILFHDPALPPSGAAAARAAIEPDYTVTTLAEAMDYIARATAEASARSTDEDAGPLPAPDPHPGFAATAAGPDRLSLPAATNEFGDVATVVHDRPLEARGSGAARAESDAAGAGAGPRNEPNHVTRPGGLSPDAGAEIGGRDAGQELHPGALPRHAEGERDGRDADHVPHAGGLPAAATSPSYVGELVDDDAAPPAEIVNESPAGDDAPPPYPATGDPELRSSTPALVPPHGPDPALVSPAEPRLRAGGQTFAQESISADLDDRDRHTGPWVPAPAAPPPDVVWGDPDPSGPPIAAGDPGPVDGSDHDEERPRAAAERPAFIDEETGSATQPVTAPVGDVVERGGQPGTSAGDGPPAPRATAGRRIPSTIAQAKAAAEAARRAIEIESASSSISSPVAQDDAAELREADPDPAELPHVPAAEFRQPTDGGAGAVGTISPPATPADAPGTVVPPAPHKTISIPTPLAPAATSKLEIVAEEILRELRRRHEEPQTDFSVTKLFAGIVQMLVLPVLLSAYLNRADAVLLPTLVFALTLQAMTIALLIMGKQK